MTRKRDIIIKLLDEGYDLQTVIDMAKASRTLVYRAQREWLDPSLKETHRRAQKAAERRYIAKDPERARGRQRRYRERQKKANPEKYKAMRKVWARRWNRAHPGRDAEQQRMRRYKKRKAAEAAAYIAAWQSLSPSPPSSTERA
jgi:hypothetical protein